MADDLDISNLMGGYSWPGGAKQDSAGFNPQEAVNQLLKSNESFYGEMLKRQEAQNANAAAGQKRLEAISARELDLFKNRPSPVPPPKLADLPKPPPDSSPRDPAQALGSTMSIFAMLASLTARRPMTAMLGAAAGVIKGFNQGEKEKAELQMQRYKAALEEAIEEQRQQTLQYEAALNDHRFTEQEREAQLNALMVQYKDEVARQTLQQGGIERFNEVLMKRQEAQTKVLSDSIHWEMQMLGKFAPKPLTGEQLHKDQITLQARTQLEQLLARQSPSQRQHLEDLMKQFPQGAKNTMGNLKLQSADPSDMAFLQLVAQATQPTYGEGAPSSATLQTQPTQTKVPANATELALPEDLKDTPEGTRVGEWTVKGGKLVKTSSLPVSSLGYTDLVGSN